MMENHYCRHLRRAGGWGQSEGGWGQSEAWNVIGSWLAEQMGGRGGASGRKGLHEVMFWFSLEKRDASIYILLNIFFLSHAQRIPTAHVWSHEWNSVTSTVHGHTTVHGQTFRDKSLERDWRRFWQGVNTYKTRPVNTWYVKLPPGSLPHNFTPTYSVNPPHWTHSQ